MPSHCCKGKQNMGAPNFVRQAYTMHISIKSQDCSVVPSQEAHGVRLDASTLKSMIIRPCTCSPNEISKSL